MDNLRDRGRWRARVARAHRDAAAGLRRRALDHRAAAERSPNTLRVAQHHNDADELARWAGENDAYAAQLEQGE